MVSSGFMLVCIHLFLIVSYLHLRLGPNAPLLNGQFKYPYALFRFDMISFGISWDIPASPGCRIELLALLGFWWFPLKVCLNLLCFPHLGTMSEADRANGEKDNTDFDGVFEHISSFGRLQRILFFGLNAILVFAVTNQFSLLVFAFGTPGFHCVTPNVTCEEKKCCDYCKEYEFDGPYHSTVSEVWL